MAGGDYGRAVPAAERSRAVNGVASHYLIAFPAKYILGDISEDPLSLGIPEHNILFEVDGVGAVWGAFQALQEARWYLGAISHDFAVYVKQPARYWGRNYLNCML